MENCTFCKIVNNELPGNKIYEDEDVLAFMDIQPVNPGHLLIIPKKHAELISEVDDSVVAKMNVIAKKLNIALRKSGLKAEVLIFFLPMVKQPVRKYFTFTCMFFPDSKMTGLV